MRSLVSISRLSRRFLSLLHDEYWSRGIGMYEEIGLPVACFGAGGARCVPGAWFSTIPQVPVARMATHFQYRPVLECDEFLDALAANTCELWHPVKQLDCVAAAVSPGGAVALRLQARKAAQLDRGAANSKDD